MEREAELRSDQKRDDAAERVRGGGVFNLSPAEGTNFSLSHRHSGLHGDGQRVQAAALDTVNPFVSGNEPLYIPVNAATSGRTWQIQVEEVTDPDTGQIYGRLLVQLVS